MIIVLSLFFVSVLDVPKPKDLGMGIQILIDVFRIVVIKTVIFILAVVFDTIVFGRNKVACFAVVLGSVSDKFTARVMATLKLLSKN